MTTEHFGTCAQAWGVRLILEALISFLPTPADGALGALDWSSAERRKLAQESVKFFCPVCNCHVKDLLPVLKKTESEATSGGYTSRFQKEIQELQRLQLQEHAREEGGVDDQNGAGEVDSTRDSATVMIAGVINTITTDTSLTRSGNNAVEDAIPQGSVEDEPIRRGISSSRESSGIVTESDATISVTAQTGRVLSADVVDESNNNNDETMPILPEVSLNAQPRVQHHVDEEGSPTDSSKALDPMLHSIIILLSVIVYLQVRKIQALMSDWRALEYA